MFQALADATRRDIMSRVVESGQSVSALAQDYDMSFAAVQKHVAVLERATLVTKERRGREQIVRGNLDAIRRASRLLDEYEKTWQLRAQQIDTLLAQE